MSPKIQFTLPIVVKWTKGMYDPHDEGCPPQKTQVDENDTIGCITWLSTRSSRLHRLIAIIGYQ